jgi:effector-binding domain-containing protein
MMDFNEENQPFAEKGPQQNGSQGSGYQNRNGNWGGHRSGNNNNSGGGNNNYGNRTGQFQRQGNFQKKEVDPESVVLYRPYVGTGNKDIPPNIAEIFKRLAKELHELGYILRTGCLDGTEQVLESCDVAKEVHIPWKGFNDRDTKFSYVAPEAKILAARYQPGYDGLKPVIQAFLAKNVRLVMGQNVKSPALFALIWSEDAAETVQEKSVKTGSVGHVIVIASLLKIPIFNLARPDAEARLKQYLQVNNG